MELKHMWISISNVFDYFSNVMVECEEVSRSVISDNSVQEDILYLFESVIIMMKEYYISNDRFQAEEEYQKIYSNLSKLYGEFCKMVGSRYIKKVQSNLAWYDDDTIIKVIPTYYSIISREIDEVKKRLDKLEIIIYDFPGQSLQFKRLFEDIILLKNHHDTIINALSALDSITKKKKNIKRKENVVGNLISAVVGAVISAAVGVVLHYLGVL